MHTTQIRYTDQIWDMGSVGGRVGGRPRMAFTRRARMQSGDTQPRLTIRLISMQSFTVMATSKMPEIPTGVASPWAEGKKIHGKCSVLCLAKGTAIPNKLGPVGEGREGRHPAKPSEPPPLPLTGIRAQPCH